MDLYRVQKALEEEKRGTQEAKIEIAKVKKEAENVKKDLLAAEQLEEAKIENGIKSEISATEPTETE